MKISILYLAAAAAGPLMVDVLGYHLPVLSALLSFIGLVGASVIAPPPPLAKWQRVVLLLVLCCVMFGLLLTDPQRNPLVSTSWAIGIGFAGLPLLHKFRDIVLGRTSELLPAPLPTVSASDSQAEELTA